MTGSDLTSRKYTMPPSIFAGAPTISKISDLMITYINIIWIFVESNEYL